MTSRTTKSGKEVLIFVSLVGIFFTFLEMTCYLFFFYYLASHDKNVAANILKPSVIKHRNKVSQLQLMKLSSVTRKKSPNVYKSCPK